MTRNRKDAGLRRGEILRATVAQIEKQGIHPLRISDVAGDLAVSPALVIYHFRTKEALIGAAFTWAVQRDLDRLAQLTAGSATALDRLTTALDWYAPTKGAKGWTLWIEGWAAALREPAMRTVGRELDLRWKEALTAIIQEGVDLGEFTADDPSGAAWRITALLDGVAVQTVVHRETRDREQTAAWARQIIARELGLRAAALERG
ncbi:TetR/AcrR family transcriptional regulator [Streptomyces sp. RKAG337]|uniref:TetR/AcrR family transcriptional regulator n=1 Tax=Streptomyces sp. RKAG337 TaxID=2893404 RepID=UPI0020349CEB|nr:TetR/AcrR family transcriptional regulator [Streptomyces sp. RKAG337]MCM2424992.1 TetR family transcriptional regulator [Streptomyces sp. RKAG337]